MTADLDEQLEALRSRVVLVREVSTESVRIGGENAHAALDALLPSDLFLRDAQARQSLLLDVRGRPIADVLVGLDDDAFVLLVDGLSRAQLAEHLEQHLAPGCTVTYLRDTFAHLSLHGPFAWELLDRVLGPGVASLPYLSFFHEGEVLGIRAGKTGEYGYELLVPHAGEAALVASLRDAGAAFGLVDATEDALLHASFENHFFDPRRLPTGDVTPLELQLQWRLSTAKSWVGKEAIDARRARGVSERLVAALAAAECAPGDAVFLGDTAIGRLATCAFSRTRKEWLVHALLEPRYAISGIAVFDAAHDGARVPLLTVSAPVLDNLSLYVDPRRHAYATRHEVVAPPRVRPFPIRVAR